MAGQGTTVPAGSCHQRRNAGSAACLTGVVPSTGPAASTLSTGSMGTFFSSSPSTSSQTGCTSCPGGGRTSVSRSRASSSGRSAPRAWRSSSDEISGNSTPAARSVSISLLDQTYGAGIGPAAKLPPRDLVERLHHGGGVRHAGQGARLRIQQRVAAAAPAGLRDQLVKHLRADAVIALVHQGLQRQAQR